MNMLPVSAIESMTTDWVKLGVSPAMPVMYSITGYSAEVLGVDTSSSISSFLSGKMQEETVNFKISQHEAMLRRARIQKNCILKDYIQLTKLQYIYLTIKMKKEQEILAGQLQSADQKTRAAGRQELKKKISRLRYELHSLSDKIGKSRDEQFSFSCQKEYEAKQRQFNFFKDMKRRYQSVSVADHRQQSIKESPMQRQFLHNGRYKQEAIFSDNSSFKLSEQSSSRIAHLRKNLEQKFTYYCKSKERVPPYFSDVPRQGNVMSYKGFLLFTKHSGLEDVLTFEERLRIFNKCTKFKKRLLFNEFVLLLEDCCKLICEKHQKKFTKYSYNIFLTKILSKLQISFIVPQHHSIKRLQIHTGLYKQSMVQILQDSRKGFEEKKMRSLMERKKALSRIKLSLPLPHRSASQQSQLPQKTILQSKQQDDKISILKRIKTENVSYTSIAKNRHNYDKTNMHNNSRVLVLSQPKSKRSNHSISKRQQYKLLTEIVDLEQPDSILEQMLSKNY